MKLTTGICGWPWSNRLVMYCENYQQAFSVGKSGTVRSIRGTARQRETGGLRQQVNVLSWVSLFVYWVTMQSASCRSLVASTEQYQSHAWGDNLISKFACLIEYCPRMYLNEIWKTVTKPCGGPAGTVCTVPVECCSYAVLTFCIKSETLKYRVRV